MTKDWKRLKLRRQELKRWKEGREKATGEVPTENEFHGFLAGFNMGYDAHKNL